MLHQPEISIYLYDDELNNTNLQEDKGRTKAIRNKVIELKTSHLISQGVLSAKDVYLRNRECNESSGFGKSCKDCALIEYHSLNSPFILFIHTSNKCFYRFVAKFLKSNTLCWIVCYSGGDTANANAYEALKETYPSKKNIKFFPHISLSLSSEALNQRWDINAFIEAVIRNQPNPFEYLERKGTPHLIAISILCQGYLATHGVISLPDNLGKLKRTVKSKAGITENLNWWLTVISENTKSARAELGDRKNKKAVEDLLDAIDGNALSGSNGIKIVESAYKVLPEILQGTS